MKFESKNLPQYQVDVLTEINKGNTEFEAIVNTTGHHPLKVHRAMKALEDIGFIQYRPKVKPRHSAVLLVMALVALLWMFRWPLVVITAVAMIVKVM